MYTLSGDVGGPNKAGTPSDVRIVKEMLVWNKVYAGRVDDVCDDAMIAAIKTFQSRFLATPDGWVRKNSTTFKRLSGENAPTFRMIYGPFWHEHEDGQSLNWELVQRVKMLAVDLLGNDMVTDNIRFNEGVRSRQRAHRMSTSWFLRQPDGQRPSKIPIRNLLMLPGGRDLDGNAWFDPVWSALLETWQPMPPDSPEDISYTDKSLNVVWKLIRERAYQIEPQQHLAAEGYPLSDAHILPNVHSVISNHVGGNAIDCTIRWKRGSRVTPLGPDGAPCPAPGMVIADGDLNDIAANFVIAQYGLCRPVNGANPEPWHFQLAPIRRSLPQKRRTH